MITSRGSATLCSVGRDAGYTLAKACATATVTGVAITPASRGLNCRRPGRAEGKERGQIAQPDVSSFRVGYTRAYSSPDGVSHFGDGQLAMQPVAYVQGVSQADPVEAEPPTALRFSHITTGHVIDWHPTPRRQFVLMLSGVMEVRVGDGDTRHFGPGSVLFVEDTVGQGHQTPYTPRFLCNHIQLETAAAKIDAPAESRNE